MQSYHFLVRVVSTLASPARVLQVSIPEVRPFDSHLGNILIFRFDPKLQFQSEGSGCNRMPQLQPDAPSDELAISCPKTIELH
jgi:hypothetical protein